MEDTFPRLMLEHARHRPQAPALREKEYGIWQTLTWQQLAELVRALAAGLHAAGLRRGQHLVVIGENRPRLYASMLAAQAIRLEPGTTTRQTLTMAPATIVSGIALNAQGRPAAGRRVILKTPGDIDTNQTLAQVITGPDGRLRPAGTLPALARAGGEWPAGCVGDAALQTRLQSLQLLATRLRQALAEPVLPPRALALRADLDGEALQLQADFADLRASGLLRWRDGEARATDYLDAWLAHLALCATAPAGVALRTRWLGADGAPIELHARGFDHFQ